MKVRDVMTRYLWTVRLDDGLDRAAHLMRGRGCGCLPVVDESARVVGMVTDRDICMTLVRRAARPGTLRVRDAATVPAIVCGPKDTLEDARARMARHRLRRLPVVDEEGRGVGLLSLDDLARHIDRPQGLREPSVSAEAVGRTLREIVGAPR